MKTKNKVLIGLAGVVAAGGLYLDSQFDGTITLKRGDFVSVTDIVGGPEPDYIKVGPRKSGGEYRSFTVFDGEYVTNADGVFETTQRHPAEFHGLRFDYDLFQSDTLYKPLVIPDKANSSFELVQVSSNGLTLSHGDYRSF